jgi:tRNA isopentenyl-2-thiomethyl-A-37 hydroxylase MiaE
MRAVRKGRREQVIDHLIACSFIEGRSCEKFQILAERLGISIPSWQPFTETSLSRRETIMQPI